MFGPKEDFTQALCDTTALPQRELQHLTHIANHIGCAPDTLVGISMWGDGVPFNNNRSHSLEMLSLAILTCQDQSLRIPLCSFPKHLAAGSKTWEAIWVVMKWSLECAGAGLMPDRRHDGTPFGSKDIARRKQILQPVPRAFLLQIRGDWAYYKAVFALPAWNQTAGICWRCNMVPSRVSEVFLHADWRQPHNRKDNWQAIAALERPTPLLGVPFFDMSLIQLDWLHIMDIGVALHWLGSVFTILVGKFPGTTIDQRSKQFHLRMKQYYKDFAVDSRLPLFKPSMLQKDTNKSKASKFPKLRAKAGEARGLILFALLQCQNLLSSADPFENAILQSAVQLHTCYQQLSQQAFEPATLHRAGLKFAALYVTLNEFALQQGRNLFKVTPKLHLFCEMTLDPASPPSTGWTYRDEDFGGHVAQFAQRRGGALTCVAVGKAMFQKFAALYNVPAL